MQLHITFYFLLLKKENSDMATVQNLTESSIFKMLTLVGGKNGIKRTISGINVVESVDSSDFCKSNELIISTGINISGNTETLLALITELANRHTAGIVINIGPYIPVIPLEALELANRLNFPLFEMEWGHRIADLLKMTFHFLNTHQPKRLDERELMLNVLFEFKDSEMVEQALQDFGYNKNDEMAIILCTPLNSHIDIQQYFPVIHKAFSARYHHFLKLLHNNQLIYLISRSHVQTPNIPFSRTVNSIFKKLHKTVAPVSLTIGMGNFYTAAKDIQKSFQEATTVTKLSQQHGNTHLYKYKDLGAYKIIMGINNPQLLNTFYHDMLDPLIQYDQLHQANLMHFLHIFIEEGGSTSRISKREFIHRNTVLYKVRKIETILDVDLNSSFTKTNLAIAFMIEDVQQN